MNSKQKMISKPSTPPGIVNLNPHMNNTIEGRNTVIYPASATRPCIYMHLDPSAIKEGSLKPHRDSTTSPKSSPGTQPRYWPCHT